jgi:hypothetical protein
MKKMVLIAGALMLLASSAMAGTNLAWNDCVGSGVSAADRTVACTNTGSGTLYLSFDPGVDLPQMAASAGLIDVVTTNPFGSWWAPATFGSRWGSGSATGLSGVCPGWFDAAPSGPIVFAPSQVTGGSGSPNRLRIHLDAVIAAGEEQNVTAGTEWFSGSLSLKFNAGTAGNAECTAGGAIGVYDLNLQQPGGVPDTHMGQTPLVANCATFRGGGGQTCPGATPTKKATWGSIKALYR